MSHHYHLDSDYCDSIDLDIQYSTSDTIDNVVFSLRLCSALTGYTNLYSYKGEEAKKNFDAFIKNVDKEEHIHNRRYLVYKKSLFDLYYPEMSKRIDWKYLSYNNIGKNDKELVGKNDEELVVKLRCYSDNYFKIVNKI